MSEIIQFEEFSKIPRLRRECVVTEKLDGTNAQIMVVDTDLDGEHPDAVTFSTTEKYTRLLFAGSRSRWLKPGKTTDNFGFAQWVFENAEQLAQLGPGRHYGEWWGQGIQRGYGLDHKRFSLFNVARWVSREEFESEGDELRKKFPKIAPCPDCCDVVPIIYHGIFSDEEIENAIDNLIHLGSLAATGFKPAEGIVVYHTAGNVLFKQTIEKDDEPKGTQKEAA